jgi:Uma2 family endonuclease
MTTAPSAFMTGFESCSVLQRRDSIPRRLAILAGLRLSRIWIIDEPELHLGQDILVPDLAGWRRERMPAYPDAAFFELPPDWVCEVVSPSTGSLDRVRKMPKYAANQVAHLWLADPLLRTLEIFRLENEHWLLLATRGDDEKVRGAPFDAIEIDLSQLWS